MGSGSMLLMKGECGHGHDDFVALLLQVLRKGVNSKLICTHWAAEVDRVATQQGENLVESLELKRFMS